MAGGPILPIDARPITADRVFPMALRDEDYEGLAFQASLGADSIWRCFYQVPQTVPSGTATLFTMYSKCHDWGCEAESQVEVMGGK